MAQKFLTEITLQALNNATTDTDKFLVSDGGTIKFRTGAEVLSDIGGQAALTNPVTGTGANTQVAFWTGTNTQSGDNAFLYNNSTGLLTLKQKSQFVGFRMENQTTSTSALTIDVPDLNYARFVSNQFRFVSNGLTTYRSDITSTTFDASSFHRFLIAGAEAVRLNSAGNFGIGTITPSQKLEVTGTGYASSDFRAPIFYDSNNTNYYLDPAGFSFLRAIGLDGYTQYATSVGSPSANFGNGRVYLNVWPTANGANIMSFKIAISTTWNWAPGFGYITADVSFYFDGTNLNQATTTITSATGPARENLGIGNPVIDGGNVCIPIYSSNSNPILAKIDGSASFNWGLVSWGSWQSVAFPGAAVVSMPGNLSVAGSITSNSSVRSPIFVDLNDSNYYLDPSSTSNIVGLTVANTITGNISGTASGENLATVTSRGNIANTSIALRNSLLVNKGDGSSGGALSYDSAINQLYLWNSLSSGYFSVYTNNSERLNISSSGVVTANVDMRAPIFYDSNDTTYYLDPNNTTTALNVAGKVQVNYGASSGTPIFQATGSYGTMSLNTYYGVFHTSGDFYIGNPAGGAANLTGAQANFNIFSDRNNSAYFADPTATSNFVGLTVANTISGNITGNAGTVSTITNRTNLMVNSLAAPALIDSLTTANFRSTLFGTTSNGYQISTARWNTTPSVLSGLTPYSTMIAWAGSDTQGFLAMDYSSPAARVGGGNGNNINWTRRVLLEDAWTNSKYFSSGGEIYAPAFYDANDSSFYFDGTNTGDSIRVAGDIVAYYSDERLKNKKGNIENALEKVLSLNGFYYEPNETAQSFGYKKKLEVGVSAQEVEAVLPELIKDAPIGRGYKTLDYGKLTPLLIEAVKEQQKQIEELKELVNKLINK
jgi:hypothetical protein